MPNGGSISCSLLFGLLLIFILNYVTWYYCFDPLKSLILGGFMGRFLCIAAAVCVCSITGSASTILFSDLGTGDDLYSLITPLSVFGSTNCACGFSSTWADPFSVSGTGNEAVTQIDLAVGQQSGPAYASIWTDASGVPGAQVGNAFWSFSGANTAPECCDLVSITGISGVTLTGADSYFLVVGPLSNDTGLAWYRTASFFDETEYLSNDGGSTWQAFLNFQTAFDIQGTSAPEPSSSILLGAAITVLAAAHRSQRTN
jgi:hypothetical protein